MMTTWIPWRRYQASNSATEHTLGCSLCPLLSKALVRSRRASTYVCLVDRSCNFETSQSGRCRCGSSVCDDAHPFFTVIRKAERRAEQREREFQRYLASVKKDRSRRVASFIHSMKKSSRKVDYCCHYCTRQKSLENGVRRDGV